MVGHGVRAPGWDGGQQKNSGRGEQGDQEGAAGGGSLRELGTDRGGASVWLQRALRLGAAGAAGEMISGGTRILADFPRWGMETGPFPGHVESYTAPAVTAPFLRQSPQILGYPGFILHLFP